MSFTLSRVYAIVMTDAPGLPLLSEMMSSATVAVYGIALPFTCATWCVTAVRGVVAGCACANASSTPRMNVSIVFPVVLRKAGASSG